MATTAAATPSEQIASPVLAFLFPGLCVCPFSIPSSSLSQVSRTQLQGPQHSPFISSASLGQLDHLLYFDVSHAH